MFCVCVSLCLRACMLRVRMCESVSRVCVCVWVCTVGGLDMCETNVWFISLFRSLLGIEALSKCRSVALLCRCCGCLLCLRHALSPFFAHFLRPVSNTPIRTATPRVSGLSQLNPFTVVSHALALGSSRHAQGQLDVAKQAREEIQPKAQAF